MNQVFPFGQGPTSPISEVSKRAGQSFDHSNGSSADSKGSADGKESAEEIAKASAESSSTQSAHAIGSVLKTAGIVNSYPIYLSKNIKLIYL